MKLPLLIEGSTYIQQLAEDHDIQKSGHISGGCGGVDVYYTQEKEVVVTPIETNSDRIVAIQLKFSPSEVFQLLECPQTTP